MNWPYGHSLLDFARGLTAIHCRFFQSQLHNPLGSNRRRSVCDVKALSSHGLSQVHVPRPFVRLVTLPAKTKAV